MKQILYTFILAAMTMSAMAQQKYQQGKPNDPAYRYLDNLKGLKEYIDHDKYPNFKLGAGTTVNDYLNNRNQVRNLTNENFNETVAGNAMKMSSCVDGNGNMNFTTVKNYVNTATNAGLVVYGHTLAWHSQQPKGWLSKLIADKPAPELTDGDVDVYVALASKDFRTSQNVGWTSDKSEFGYQLNFDATNGLNIHCTKKCTNSWDVQFLAMTDIPTTSGKTYKMTMTVRGTSAGKLHTKLGDWGNGATGDVAFTTEWKDVTFNYKAIMGNSFYMLQCGDFVGDIYIKNIKFEETKKGKTINEERRCLKVEAGERKSETYDNQLWFLLGNFASGAKYEFSADVRADKAATTTSQIHNAPGTYVHYEAIGNINFTTEWKTVKLSGTFSKAGQSIAINLSELAEANNYYLDNISFKVNGVEKIKNGDLEGTDVSSFKIKTNKGTNSGAVVAPTICEQSSYVYIPSTIPLTQQERHDALIPAMEKWIKGMMEACNGKVKAWDLVNEAISGGGNDGQGNYELQHSEGYSGGTWDVGGDNFYWQDHLGDLDYVRQACRLARKYGPSDVKLFINDYNLESTWDSNKKVKSLINWIKKWESDGVTKIDGIGTQMHISYILDENQQKNQMRCITTMFELMAATGKYVRVSELDMGVCRRQFETALKTSEITPEMEQAMADYYEWIIKEYLRIVPPAQQWGICQWCPTDAPANSGWRGGEPVGIWDLSYYRKHVYAGFVRGLGGDISGIEEVELDDNASALRSGVFDLQGRRYSNVENINTLPAGLYIVGGKKVVVK